MKKIGVLFLCLIFFASLVLAYPSSWTPRIALDANENANVVAWRDGEGICFFKQSGTFGGSILTPTCTFCGSLNRGPDIALDGNGDAHVVRYGYSSGAKIWYSKLDGDTGESSGCSLLAYNPVGPVDLTSRLASIAVDGNGDAHVAVVQFASFPYPRIYYYKIDGETKTKLIGPVLVSDPNINYYPHPPNIVVDSDNNAHIVWAHDINPASISSRIMYTKIHGDGPNLGDPIIVYTQISSDYDNTWPSIALDGNGDAHVVWTYKDFDDPFIPIDEVYYAKINGTTGDPIISYTPLDFNLNGIFWWGPQDISVDNEGNVHIVAEKSIIANSHNESWVNYLKVNGNDTTVLIPEFKVAPNNASIPSIEVDSDGNVHIVWQKYIQSEDNFYYKSFYTKLDGDSGELIFTDIPIGDGPVINPICEGDGTLLGQCSLTRPYYCQAGELVENCQVCGCPRNRACKPDGTCLASKVKKIAMPLFSAVQEGVQKDIITRIVYFFKGLF